MRCNWLMVLAIVTTIIIAIIGCGGSGGGGSFRPTTASGIITGTITKGSGNASIRGLSFSIAAQKAKVWLEERPDLSTFADEEGKYTITNVPEGRFNVIAQLQEGDIYKNRSPKVQVTPKEPTLLDISVYPAKNIVKGKITKEDGTPFLPNTVFLYLWGQEIKLQSDGSFETPPLPDFDLEDAIQEIVINYGSKNEIRVPAAFVSEDKPAEISLVLPTSNTSAKRLPTISLIAAIENKVVSTIKPKETITLIAKVYPSDLPNDQLEWKPSSGTLSPTTQNKGESRIRTFTASDDAEQITINVSATNDSQTASAKLFLKVDIPKKYALIYNANGGIGTLPSDANKYSAGATAAILPNQGLQKTGLEFVGWNTKANGTGTLYQPGALITISNSDINLYATWAQPTNFSIVYVNLGNTNGSPPQDTKTYKTGDKAIIKQPGTLSKTGYKFLEWNTQEDGTGNSYFPGNEISIKNATINLFPIWIKLYQLSYNSNSATSGNPPNTNFYQENELIEISSNIGKLQKENHLFSGWSTTPTLGGEIFFPHDIINMPAENLILYARWTAHEPLKLIYDGNEHTQGQPPQDSNIYEAGDSTKVSANIGTLTKNFHKFSHWNTEPDNTGRTYHPAEQITFSSEDITLYAQWTPTFTITYHADEFTHGLVPTDTYHYEAEEKAIIKGNENNLSKESHNFLGWNTKPDATGIQYYPFSTLVVKDNIDLYAIWTTTQTYTLTYHPNGASSGTQPDSLYFISDTRVVVIGNLGYLAKDGYNFDGWNTNEDGTGTTYFQDDVITIFDQNIDLYAKWIPATSFRLSYNSNDADYGTLPSEPTYHQHEDSVMVLRNTGNLTKIGYNFEGWNTKPDGSGLDFIGGNTITDFSANIILYAKWKEKEYISIVYDGNGADSGEVPVDTNKYEKGVEIRVLGNNDNLKKTNYYFAHWNTKPDNTGTIYKAGQSIDNPNSNIKLYAIWIQGDSYTITYHPNEADYGTVPIDERIYKTGEKATVEGNINNLEKPGFRFISWNTKQNGSGTDYPPGSQINIKNSSFILYAQWDSSGIFLLTYHRNGASSGDLPVKPTFYEQDENIIIADNSAKDKLEKKDYRFVGWNSEPSGSGTNYTPETTIQMPSRNLILYAKWVLKERCRVYYNRNGATNGSVPTDPIEYKEGDLVTVFDKNNLSKDGYIFAGWNTKEDGSGTPYAPQDTFEIGLSNVDLYAQWKEGYGISYEPNGADKGYVPFDSNVYPPETTIYISGNTGKLSKARHHFAGWGLNSKADPDKDPLYSEGDAIIIESENIVLYAIWRHDPTYRVFYHANTTDYSGDLPRDSNEYIEGDLVKVIASQNLTKEDFVFYEWNTKSDGKGDGYNPNLEEQFYMPASHVNLYAIWHPTFTVTYDANFGQISGSGEPPVDLKQYAKNQLVVVFGNTNLRLKKHSFAGWNTQEDGSGSTFSEGDTFNITSNLTLFAKWTPNETFSVQYDKNGGTGDIPVDTTNYEPGDTVRVLNAENLTKPRHSFQSWNTKADGSGSPYMPDTSFTIGTNNITLYAIYELNETYILTYDANQATEGSIPIDKNQYEAGETVTILDNEKDLTRTGYTFIGWYSNETGIGGTKYTPGKTFNMPDHDLTIFAHWSKNPTYTITYQCISGSQGLPPVDKLPYEEGDLARIKGPNTLEKAHYFFGFWVDVDPQIFDPEKDKIYHYGEDITMGNTDILLFAYWLPNPKYAVTYDSNGAQDGFVPNDKNTYEYNETVNVLANIGALRKAEHDFGGWNTKHDATGTDYSPGQQFTMPDNNVTLYAKWIPLQSVTYNNNGADEGQVPIDNTTYKPNDNVYVSANVNGLKKTGYTLLGWNTKYDLSGTFYNFGDSFVIKTDSVSLYAHWQPLEYTISYDGNGNNLGTAPEDSQKYIINSAAQVLGNTGDLTKLGYSFAGWNTQPDASGNSYIEGQNIVFGSQDIILFALWQPIDYSVMYDENGADAGAVPNDTNLYNINSVATVLSNSGLLSKTGFTFLNWNTKADGSGTPYSQGDTITIETSDITLFAQWIHTTYTLSYHKNGAESGSLPENQSAIMGEAVQIAQNTGSLHKPGYIFSGWNTQANGEGTTYTHEDTLEMPAQNVLLFAKWSPLYYRVIYERNEADNGTVPQDLQTYSVNQHIEVKGNSGNLTKTGYTFGGWTLQPDGSGRTYFEYDSLYMGISNIVLYAKWNPINFRVFYNQNTAEGSPPVDIETYIYHRPVIVMNQGNITKTGYSFAAWGTKQDGSGINYEPGDSFDMPPADLTLYAIWTPFYYDVTYYSDLHETGVVPQVKSYIIDTKVTIEGNTGNLFRTGYLFAGWETRGENPDTSYQEGDQITIGTSNIQLYAKWETGYYSVIYDPNNATAGQPPEDQNEYAYQTNVVVLGNPHNLNRAGHNFSGWNTQPNGEGTDYSQGAIFKMPSADMTLYAKWSPIYYSITYYGNGNTSGNPPLDENGYKMGDIIEILPSEGGFLKTGYSFAGWNTKPDGAGVTYYEGNQIVIDHHSVTLYATWLEITYKITYDPNGATSGSVPVDTTNYSHDSQAAVLGNTENLLRNGYRFISWNTTTDGTGTDYNQGDVISINTSNHTLYAKWQAVYKVTYNSNHATGGEIPFDPKEYIEGENVTILGNSGELARNGYAFYAWNLSPIGNGQTYFEDDTLQMGNSNITLYVEWSPIYKITYSGNYQTQGFAPTDHEDYIKGDTIIILPNSGDLQKNFHHFNGWNTHNDGTGTAYNPGDTLIVDGTGDIMLYAHWKPYYRLFYDGNNQATGIPPEDETEYEQNDEIIIPGNPYDLSKIRNVFGGWNTEPEGKGNNYLENDIFIMPPYNVTLYTKWLPTYMVTYHTNNADSGAAPEDILEYLPGDSVNILSNSGNLKKTNYVFSGWNTKPDGSGTTYPEGGALSMPSLDLVLYAKWTPTYQVTYHQNEADSGAVPEDSNFYIQGDQVSIPANTGNLIKYSHKFGGWNTQPDGSGINYLYGDTFNMPPSNQTLYARWLPAYGVTYARNGADSGEVPEDPNFYLNGDLVTVLWNPNNLSKLGYNLKEWNTESDASGEAYNQQDNSFAMDNSNVTLYAIWEPAIYHVHYDANQGLGTPPTDEEDYNHDSTVTVKAASELYKTGFDFTGWNTKADGTGILYQPNNTFKIAYDDVTLYATWVAIEYRVHYDANGGAGTTPTDNTKYNYSSPVTVLSQGNLNQAGYTFDSWNTEQNGEGTKYSPQDTFEMPDHNVTLYAQWLANNYELAFNANGAISGTVPPSAQHPYKSNVIIPGNTGNLIKTNFEFAGWNTNAQGTGTNYTQGSTMQMPSNNVTLYAKWSDKLYTLTYDSNGGSGEIEGKSGKAGTAVSVAYNTFVKDGYNFINWNTKQDGTGTTYAPAQNFYFQHEDVILYAQWQEKQYFVSYNRNGGLGDLPSTVFKKAGETVWVENPPLTLLRTNYKFVDWNSQADGQGTSFQPGSTFTMPPMDLTLYAQWVPDVQLKIIYKKCYGTVHDCDPYEAFTPCSVPGCGAYGDPPVDTQIYSINDNAVIKNPPENPRSLRIGVVPNFREFDYWCTSINPAQGTRYNPGATYTFTKEENLILYAIYEALPQP